MNYSPELINKIVAELLAGHSMTVISIKRNIPRRTLYFWIKKANVDLEGIRRHANRPVEAPTRKKELSYAEHLSKQVKLGKMTSSERLKAIYKYKTNYDYYVFTGGVALSSEDE